MPGTDATTITDLLDDLATDGGAPVPFTYNGRQYAARTRYTGEEVLELSARLLFVAPEHPISPEEYREMDPADRKAADELHRAEINRAYNEWMVAQLAFMLAEGDPALLWDEIGERPANVSNRLVRGIMRRTGLFNAQGEFLAS
ncbi:hypothetical protein [Rhodococcus sp. SGAir0479]|uniref:hypothetical protein n=1 Tax=Rhodococcus sp. SGAir0479 TaxID=2567884 RepID=UPI0010CD1300|nr:hypothetical protein [Rhodococcus sp. SGAir0479]QCQ91725.1 hypothetical protein E7742_11110 [Rhodococcus sp. SGAir0479]